MRRFARTHRRRRRWPPRQSSSSRVLLLASSARFGLCLVTRIPPSSSLSGDSECGAALRSTFLAVTSTKGVRRGFHPPTPVFPQQSPAPSTSTTLEPLDISRLIQGIPCGECMAGDMGLPIRSSLTLSITRSSPTRPAPGCSRVTAPTGRSADATDAIVKGHDGQPSERQDVREKLTRLVLVHRHASMKRAR